MSTRISPSLNSPLKVQLARLSHVYLRHSDPERFLIFANDFGFVETHREGDAIYLRGYGKDQYCYVVLPSKNGENEFEAAAWVVSSKEDLEKALKFPGAIHKDLSALPGGGELVSVQSPSGTVINLVWGQEDREVLGTETTVIVETLGPYNKPFTKERKGQSA
jgi:hypothetical protein